MTLSVDDIDRWNADDVREVFHAAKLRATAAHDAADGLGGLTAFATWDGLAAVAARDAIGRTRVDLDAHGNEALAVANAAAKAADDIGAIKNRLSALRADADHLGLAIDPISSRVQVGPVPTAPLPVLLINTEMLQARLDALLADAARVDNELARAINMATGVEPIPDSPNSPLALPPPGGQGPMSDTQIRDAVDDMLAGQDLSPAEAERLSQLLTNDLRQASAQGLGFDAAYANAENVAASYMATELHRSYVRKATRLEIFAGSVRTPTGDFRSRATGALIPAARDASGNLIWVDERNGARVAQGDPHAMTMPERGYYQFGHQPSYENWRVLRQATEEGWTQQEFNDFMNQKGVYRLETPAENLSHAHEDHSPYAPNPQWTPPRLLNVTDPALLVAAPPSLPTVLEHPPVSIPQPVGGPPPSQLFPPLQPTPTLPPWLIDPSVGHAPDTGPLFGPSGLNIDTPGVPGVPSATLPTVLPSSPPSGAPLLPIAVPDVHIDIPPEDAAKAGGVLVAIGGVLAILGTLVNPLAGG